jgi:hypothetical protein
MKSQATTSFRNVPVGGDDGCSRYGVVSEERVKLRNGYRTREWGTRAGTIELAISITDPAGRPIVQMRPIRGDIGDRGRMLLAELSVEPGV